MKPFLIVSCFIFNIVVFSVFSHAQDHDAHSMANKVFPGTPEYVCPMHLHIVKDHPDTCPICGMDLVAREVKAKKGAEVSVSGAMQQAMALTTENVQQGRIWRTIKTYGSVQFDESRLNHIHTRAPGWIETLTVNSLGQTVKQGDLLYEIYSPELLVAQEDFLSLLASSQKNDLLLERGRRRLQLLGFNQDLIKQLEANRDVFYRVPYFAQSDGIVSALNVRQGMYSEPKDELMTLADLSSVWIFADIPQSKIDWIELERPVEVELQSDLGTSLDGQVDFLYPTLNADTRTLTARLSLANPGLKLKPDMLVNVTVYGRPLDGLTISSSALIQTESHNRVFVKTNDDLFERRDVVVGTVSRGKAHILSGLEENERVVTSGQFLLDAEANLSNVNVDHH